MLILNEADMRQTITWTQVMDQVEDAYRIFQSGEFYMPERPTIVHEQNTILYMPCFLAKDFGTKFLTLFPANPPKGLPYIDGLMLLNDGESGKTTAILDGRYLTALRTGAVGGVGVRHFSREDCQSAGVIGAGQQGFYQAIYAAAARNLRDIYLFDVVTRGLEDFAQRLSLALGEQAPRIHICGRVEELLEHSEIVISATPATSPVLPNDPELLGGKCFVAIGSYKPQMRELPDAIWKLVDCVYTELPFAMEESGDLSQPLEAGLLRKEQVKYIGEWLMQEQRPLPTAGQTTYFKSVGMGLLDLCVAQMIYQQAEAKGIGQMVKF